MCTDALPVFSVSVLLYSSALTEFPGNPGGESGSASVCTDALPEFSGSAVLCSTALPVFSGSALLHSSTLPDKLKGRYAAEVLWK